MGKAHFSNTEIDEGGCKRIVALHDACKRAGLCFQCPCCKTSRVDDAAAAETVSVGPQDFDSARGMFRIDDDGFAVAGKQCLRGITPVFVDDFGDLAQGAWTHALSLQGADKSRRRRLQRHLARACVL
ncbi:hypothetical protein D3C73_1129870 [compost metagenome]